MQFLDLGQTVLLAVQASAACWAGALAGIGRRIGLRDRLFRVPGEVV
jgi:hypothetical protein